MRISRFLTGAFFVGAGVMHFVRPGAYLKIMPPWIPAPLAMVYVSGVAEIAGGIGLWVERLRRLAGWGLVALLLAVFPANIYMATHRVYDLPGWIMWGRLPLQGVLIWWVLRVGGDRK